MAGWVLRVSVNWAASSAVSRVVNWPLARSTRLAPGLPGWPPALVRQGQISEIISAKPQSRRRILEDAAGIAGLHSRRHEAELRLRGAEENLTRLEDVLGEIDGQIESLQRQARQASRYRSLAADIRRAEATLALIAHHLARGQEAE
eukprot:gene6461-8740_t